MCVCVCVCEIASFCTHQRRAQQSNSSTKQDDNPNEGKAEEEGEWTEYVDSFGRTRRCPKEDLPLMKAAEERMRERCV